ncbi:MAG: DUF4388 domain-containing protein [Thermoanaerobaculia bacterium]|nr:DUF4388 domain-containing protein [Thermoanaerobaculia bacterium]
MALEGTLKDFSLADIFQLIGLQRKTGVLTLTGKTDTVTVTFLDGQVVAAETLNRKIENRLGHVLVKKGTISEEQLKRALQIQNETLQRLGFILVEHKIISREELRDALQLQILSVIYSLFRWNDGEYHFSQESTIEYDRENVVPITAESILMEGARMIDEWPIIEKRIRSGDMVLRKKPVSQQIVVAHEDDLDDIDFGDEDEPAKEAAPSSDAIKISEAEKQTYDLVDGERPVSEIVERSRLTEFDTCKNLYELMMRDLVEEARAEKAAPTKKTEVGQLAPTEVPTVLPLPLILILAAIAIASLVTFPRNPLNEFKGFGAEKSTVNQVKKAISLQRVASLATGIEAYTMALGNPPATLAELAPAFASEDILRDPWGHSYTYIFQDQPVENFLVIGYGPESETDTDLFLGRNMDRGLATTAEPTTGGIELVD